MSPSRRTTTRIATVLFAFAIAGACSKSKPEQSPPAESPKPVPAQAAPVEAPPAAAPAADPAAAPAAPAAPASAPLTLEGFDVKANDGKTVEVSGMLFESAGGYSLASQLCETAPPKACGTTLKLAGVDAAAATPLLTEKMGDAANKVRWSKSSVKVKGTISGGTLTATSVGPI